MQLQKGKLIVTIWNTLLGIETKMVYEITPRIELGFMYIHDDSVHKAISVLEHNIPTYRELACQV